MKKIKKPVKKKVFKYFDDCPVCLEMKKEGIKLVYQPDLPAKKKMIKR